MEFICQIIQNVQLGSNEKVKNDFNIGFQTFASSNYFSCSYIILTF